MRKAILLFFFGLSGLFLKSQPYDPELPWLRLRQQVPQFQLYAHFDKAAYLPGETAWFRAYVFNRHFPYDDSRNLFVRLLNEAGAVVLQKHLPVLAAVAQGDFLLPDSLQPGRYTVQALVPGMVYDDVVKPYEQPLYVTASATVPPAAGAVTDTLQVRFFPEGGALIHNVKTIVAFEVVNQQGQPVDASFSIVGETGELIRRTATLRHGLGRFELRPLAGKQYTIRLNNADKRVLVYRFPEIGNRGVGLRVQVKEGEVAYEISRPAGQLQPNKVFVTVHKDYEVLFSRKLYFDKYLELAGRILTGELRSGILHFVVTDSAGNLLASRKVFHSQPGYQSPFTLHTDMLSLEKRGLNQWRLQLADSVFATCSVSITDAALPVNEHANTIMSDILLTQQLRGPVYNPAWYFQHGGDSVHTTMDILMLVRESRLLSWNEARTFSTLRKTAATDPAYITLNGRVYDETGVVAQKNGRLYIVAQHEDSGSISANVPVDALGVFRVDSLICYGNTAVTFFYADNQNRPLNSVVKLERDTARYWDKSAAISLANGCYDPIFYENLIKNTDITDSVQKTTAGGDYWKNHRVVVMEAATVRGTGPTRKRPADVVNERYTMGQFRGNATRSIDLINQPFNSGAVTVWDYVKTYLAVNSANYDNITRLVSRSRLQPGNNQYYTVDVFMDEILLNITDHELLLKSTQMGNVAYIKYWGNGFLGAYGGAPGGAIAIYTKKAEDAFVERRIKATKLNIDGYSIGENFVSPQYDRPGVNASVTDNRSTLYWNGQLVFSGEHPGVIRFYNNDVTRRFRVVVQGFDSKGRFIHWEQLVGLP
jgi:hypothetical protein